MKKIITILITLVISICFISPVMAVESAADQLKSKVITDQGEKNTVWIWTSDFSSKYTTQSFFSESECQNYEKESLYYGESGKCVSHDYYDLKDGIYEDSTEKGAYVFRGKNPNNYIKLGDDLYRIVSVENDETLKVVSVKGIKATWDEGRDSEDENDYCANPKGTWYEYGCNAWGSNTTTLDRNGNHVTTMYKEVGGKEYNLPDIEANLNIYLNGEWYENLDKNVQNLIVNHDFNIGPVTYKQATLSENLEEESAYRWNGKIGLVNVTDFIKAMNINGFGNNLYDYYSNDVFFNYLETTMNTVNEAGGNERSGLLTPIANSVSSRVYDSNVDGYGIYTSPQGAAGYSYNSYPAFFLKSNITLSGSGTEDDPYIPTEYTPLSEEESDNKNPSQVVEVPSTSAYVSLIIGVAGIVLVVLAIGVIYFTSKKKKTKIN